MKKLFLIFLIFPQWLLSEWNNPYPSSEKNENISYRRFREKPKFLDPVRSYSSDEWRYLGLIYEPVLQYHYLKKPYQLIPLTAEHLPDFQYFDKAGAPLPRNADSKNVFRAVWTIHLKKNIRYQNHPCFAKDKQGKLLYQGITEERMQGIDTLFDFTQFGTRTLKAEDYVLQIKRLADKRMKSPLFSLQVTLILGFGNLSEEIGKRIETIRKAREDKAREENQIFFNREEDEEKHPIVIPYHEISCKGLKILDDHTFQIILSRKYPQFRYWLATPFFAPIPREAILFYEQGPLRKRGITLNENPIGTGPYRMDRCNPNFRFILTENENFHDEFYPRTASPEYENAGFLKDAGKKLPLIKKIIFTKETEVTPWWMKFNQGYYDISAISEDNFFSVVNFSGGSGDLSEDLRKKGIKMLKHVSATVYYNGFNMIDPILGGYDEKKCKLRQALSIAINNENYVQIFLNGRGMAAQGPIPPGIFGNKSGKDGINPFVYNWNEKNGKAERKSIEEARQLLKEAGYPQGMNNETGKQLTIFYDQIKSTGNASRNEWLRKQLAHLGVALEIRETDYNRFREKMDTGDYQMYSWGWHADYPDPENFLFLFYGPNGKTKFKGENVSNYSSPEFDELFKKMETMESSPERLEIIQEMLKILRHDAAWDFGYNYIKFGLFHHWYQNATMDDLIINRGKYHSVDHLKRNRFTEKENQPAIWPLALVIFLLLAFLIPGMIMIFKKETG